MSIYKIYMKKNIHAIKDVRSIPYFHKFYLEQAMVQKHLECDEFFNTYMNAYSNRMFLAIDAKVSRNMFFHHTCSKFMN